jgi:hypothetical protein
MGTRGQWQQENSDDVSSLQKIMTTCSNLSLSDAIMLFPNTTPPLP